MSHAEWDLWTLGGSCIAAATRALAGIGYHGGYDGSRSISINNSSSQFLSSQRLKYQSHSISYHIISCYFCSFQHLDPSINNVCQARQHFPATLILFPLTDWLSGFCHLALSPTGTGPDPLLHSTASRCGDLPLICGVAFWRVSRMQRPLSKVETGLMRLRLFGFRPDEVHYLILAVTLQSCIYQDYNGTDDQGSPRGDLLRFFFPCHSSSRSVILHSSSGGLFRLVSFRPSQSFGPRLYCLTRVRHPGGK